MGLESALQPDVAPDAAPAGASPSIVKAPAISRGYAYYALALLVLANFFNYFDRQLMSVLAEVVKADLQLTDAQLGFLFGTAFALLFGVVGIPMGRIADAVSRTKLMAIGLTFWSAMTGLAGAATNFGQFAAARMGVGVGEAVANPCSHSLISDYFPARVRSTAISFYFVGAYAGTGAALLLGGLMIEHWDKVCHLLPFADGCSIRNWKATFMLACIPGLIVAALVFMLREPPRHVAATRKIGVGGILQEVVSTLPPFTILDLMRLGGRRAAIQNLNLAAAVFVAVLVLGFATGDWWQWAGASLSAYAVGSWAQNIRLRDRGVFALTFGDRTFVLIMASTAAVSVVTTTMYIWATPFAIRVIGMAPAQAGLMIGVTIAVTACVGGVLGGMLGDVWKRRDIRAPLWMNLLSMVLSAPALLVMVTTRDPLIYVAAFGAFSLVAHINTGPVGALIQDLTLPRMRGTASAVNAMVILTFCATIGPYLAGKVSTITGSLATGLLAVWIFAPIAIVISLMAAQRVPLERMEEREARAAAA